MLVSAMSNRLTSMSRPTPVARAPVSAASSAYASPSPDIRSTIESPKRAGGAPGSPVSEK